MNAMITVTRYENEANSNALCLKKYNKKITMKNKEKMKKKETSKDKSSRSSVYIKSLVLIVEHETK